MKELAKTIKPHILMVYPSVCLSQKIAKIIQRTPVSKAVALREALKEQSDKCLLTDTFIDMIKVWNFCAHLVELLLR